MQLASPRARTCLTVDADPAVHADLVAVAVARIVSELVVARPTELRAGRVVVVSITEHAHLVAYVGGLPRLDNGVPLLTRQDDPGEGHALN